MACKYCGTKHRANSTVDRIETDIDTVVTSEICTSAGRAFIELQSPASVITDPTARPFIESELDRQAAISRNGNNGPKTQLGWATGSDETTMDDLIEWATTGWPGAPTETAEILWDEDYRDTFVISDAGSDGLDEATYATGDPTCMIEYRQALNPVPAPVKAVVNGSYNSSTRAEDVLVWAEAMSIAMQTVRVAGGQVEMFGANSSTANGGKERNTMVWPIADSRYPLPVAVEAFLSGHPSILRIMSFAVDNSMRTNDSYYHKHWGNMNAHGSAASIDLFAMPDEWHDARLIPGPHDYNRGYTNAYGVERDRGLRHQDRDSMVVDIMAALGWKIAE